MKQIQALIAAFIVTVLVAAGMLAIGASALANSNTVPLLDSPSADPAGANDTNTAQNRNADSSQVAQLQDLVKQYQDREQQYQSRLDDALAQIKQYQSREQQYQSQLDTATQQLEQLQNLLTQLQRIGVIRISPDGTVQLGRGFGRRGD